MKMNKQVYLFPLFVSSKTCCHAEFNISKVAVIDRESAERVVASRSASRLCYPLPFYLA